MDYVLHSAREKGARRIELHVSVLNQAAQELYRKHGFRFQRYNPLR